MLLSLQDVLISNGKSIAGRHELMQFGRFVGSWDLDVIYYNPDGSIRMRTRGEWHFGWVLEGRAVCDVWMIPPRAHRDPSGVPAGEYGMSVRFFDEAIDAWRSTWLGPVNRVVYPFIARQVGDEMILERSEDGVITRWIFSEIAVASFRWRSIQSTDAGNNWQLQQEMFAIRSGP